MRSLAIWESLVDVDAATPLDGGEPVDVVQAPDKDALGRLPLELYRVCANGWKP